jgi:hypothetical protein
MPMQTHREDDQDQGPNSDTSWIVDHHAPPVCVFPKCRSVTPIQPLVPAKRRTADCPHGCESPARNRSGTEEKVGWTMRRRRWLVVLAVVLTAACRDCVPGSGRAPLDPSANPAGVVAPATATATAEPSSSPEPSATPTIRRRPAPTETYGVGPPSARPHTWRPSTADTCVVPQDRSRRRADQPVGRRRVSVGAVQPRGSTSSPEAYRVIATRIAAAGFVVAAPAYPIHQRLRRPVQTQPI